MIKLTDLQFEVLYELAEQHGFAVRSYSGRGMMGRTCLGIDTTQSLFTIGMVIGSALALAAPFDKVSVREDSMGKETIVYFPNIEAPE